MMRGIPVVVHGMPRAVVCRAWNQPGLDPASFGVVHEDSRSDSPLRERGDSSRTRRIDPVVRVGYEDDLRRGRTNLLDVVTSDTQVLEESRPRVTVHKLADIGVDLNVRPRVDNADSSETR
jgi:hypothetical protein